MWRILLKVVRSRVIAWKPSEQANMLISFGLPWPGSARFVLSGYIRRYTKVDLRDCCMDILTEQSQRKLQQVIQSTDLHCFNKLHIPAMYIVFDKFLGNNTNICHVITYCMVSNFWGIEWLCSGTTVHNLPWGSLEIVSTHVANPWK